MANDMYQDDGNQSQFDAEINMLQYIDYMIEQANKKLQIIRKEAGNETD